MQAYRKGDRENPASRKNTGSQHPIRKIRWEIPSQSVHLFAELFSECNTLYITEGEAFIAMIYFLNGTSKEQFTSVKSYTADEDSSVSC